MNRYFFITLIYVTFHQVDMNDCNFVILTRTSKRQIFFDECRQSILQLRTNRHIKMFHVVSYDDNTTLNMYLNDEKYTNVMKMKVKKVERESFEHFPYNLYFNQMIEHLFTTPAFEFLHNENTWVLYLDDDDIYVDKDMLVELYDLIELYQQSGRFDMTKLMMLWKVRFPEKIVPTAKSFRMKPVIGETSTIGVCHNIMAYDNPFIRWDNMKQGDFRFITRIFELPDTKTIWIDKIYTSVNYTTGIGGLGMLRDKNDELVTRDDVMTQFEQITKNIRRAKIRASNINNHPPSTTQLEIKRHKEKRVPVPKYTSKREKRLHTTTRNRHTNTPSLSISTS
jgi:hypothetical protein